MHIIRLRSPWKSACEADVCFQRCDVPDLNEHLGRVVYQRSFNRPTGLANHQRVWLMVHRWDGRLESLRVNGRAFSVRAGEESCRVDITDQLQLHNQIELTLTANAEVSPRLIGPVELGIDS
jgi:hypothetical protein